MVVAAARVVVGVLFLVSGLAKLWVPGPFPGAVSRLVPVPAVSALVVAGLPAAEVMLGALVLVGRWPRLVDPVVLALAVVFVGARLLGWLDASCGCFGGVELGERAGLVLDLVLAGCSAVSVAGTRLARP